MSTTALATVSAAGPRLLDQLREKASKRFGRPEPGERFAQWACRYVLFHDAPCRLRLDSGPWVEPCGPPSAAWSTTS